MNAVLMPSRGTLSSSERFRLEQTSKGSLPQSGPAGSERKLLEEAEASAQCQTLAPLKQIPTQRELPACLQIGERPQSEAQLVHG